MVIYTPTYILTINSNFSREVIATNWAEFYTPFGNGHEILCRVPYQFGASVCYVFLIYPEFTLADFA